MTIVALEWLTFGLGRLGQAARDRGVDVELLAGDLSFYRYELRNGQIPGLRITSLDTFDMKAVIAHLEGIEDLQGLISTTDMWSLSSLDLLERLELPGPNPAGTLLARNKDRLRSRLHERGLSASEGYLFDPATITEDALIETISSPFIIKDNAGTGSRNVWLIRTAADVNNFLTQLARAELRGLLTAEALICGPLYSVETLSWKGETRVLGVSSRVVPPPPSFREEGSAFPVAFPEPDRRDLELWTTRVLEAVDHTDGFAHVEFIVTRSGYEVVEVNARLGGGLIGESICRSSGVNIFSAFIDLALGVRPSLMDAEMAAGEAFAEVDLYAPEAGRFAGIEGVELLELHPGDPVIYQIREVGDVIVSTSDHRGSVGSVFASGATTEFAMHNALSAAGKLRPAVDASNSSGV